MTDPITPPFDLVQEWIKEPQYMTEDQLGKRMNLISMNEVKFREIIDKISQYSADQELEACCQSMKSVPSPLGVPFGVMASNALRAARRPKPPSLKEQALEALGRFSANAHTTAHQMQNDFDLFRRALEALDD